MPLPRAQTDERLAPGIGRRRRAGLRRAGHALWARPHEVYQQQIAAHRQRHAHLRIAGRQHLVSECQHAVAHRLRQPSAADLSLSAASSISKSRRTRNGRCGCKPATPPSAWSAPVSMCGAPISNWSSASPTVRSRSPRIKRAPPPAWCQQQVPVDLRQWHTCNSKRWPSVRSPIGAAGICRFAIANCPAWSMS